MSLARRLRQVKERPRKGGNEDKELLGKYGVAKLSAVDEKDYPALLAEAKVL